MIYLIRTEQPKPDVGPGNPRDSRVKRQWIVEADTKEKAVTNMKEMLEDRGYAGEEIVSSPYPVLSGIKQIDQFEEHWRWSNAQEAKTEKYSD